MDWLMDWLRAVIVITVLVLLIVAKAERRVAPPTTGVGWGAALRSVWEGVRQEWRQLRWAMLTVPPERRRPLWLVLLMMAPMVVVIAAIVVAGWR